MNSTKKERLKRLNKRDIAQEAMEGSVKNYHIDNDEQDQRSISWHAIQPQISRFKPHIKSLSYCLLLLATFSLLSLAGPLLVRHAIDVNFMDHDIKGLLVTTILYFLVLVLSFGFNFIQQVKLETVGQNIIRGLRIDVFSHIMRLPQSFFDRNPVGKLLSRVESDTEALRTLFTQSVVTIISDLLMMIGMFFIMFTISPRLSLIVFSIAPLVIFIVRYFNRRIVPIFLQVRRKTAEIYGFIEEYMIGVRIVQAFDQESNVVQHMDRINQAKLNVEYPGEVLSNYFGHMVFLMSTFATVMVLGFGGHWALNPQSGLTIGTLVAFLGYIQRFFGPIFHLSEQLNVIQRAAAGARHIQEILSVPHLIHSSLPNEIQSDVTSRTNEYEIEFDHVWFAYSENDWVLRDVSFQIKKGQHIAFVGPTGGGKTTLISLIFRFYDPQRGRIRLDGLDIRTIPLDVLRRRLGLVMQDIVFFPGTILDNLRLDDPSVTDSMVHHALEAMNAMNVMDRLEKGLETELSEQGANLSVGERQILSFARALVYNPNILVLDEATSSIDPLTEHRVQGALQTLLHDRTALIIAHRLQTILESDLIMVIQRGSIVERGTHSELIESKGVYWNLYQIQQNGRKAS